MNYSKLYVHIILCIAALFCTINIAAQNTDSLKQIISQQRGEEKLKTMLTLAVKYNGSPEVVPYLLQLEKETVEQKNLVFQSKVMAFLVIHYDRVGKTDSLSICILETSFMKTTQNYLYK